MYRVYRGPEDIKRTTRGHNHMMRGVREMRTVIGGHKSGEKIKVSHSWHSIASHLHSSNDPEYLLVLFYNSNIVLLRISIGAWHETTRMTRGQAPLPLQSTDRAGSGQVQSVHYTGQLWPGSGLCCPDYLSSGLRPDTKQWNVRYTCLTQTSLLPFVTLCVVCVTIQPRPAAYIFRKPSRIIAVSTSRHWIWSLLDRA